MKRLALTFALAALFAACAVGPKVETFGPAQKAGGVEASLRISGDVALAGELLAVDDSGLTLLDRGEVTRVAYSNILHATFAATRISLGGAQQPSATTRDQLRLISRYPQGLSPSLLRSLLAAYAQSEVKTLPR